MTSYDYDLFTIGAGSGGVRTARVCAGYGARVGIAEARYLGGTCVNVGCVPKKLLVYASHFASDFEDARGFGWAPGTPSFDWSRLIAHKDREIARLNGVYRRLLEGAGVEIVEGHARLVDPHTVAIGERKVTAEHILVATGSWPAVPPIPGAEHAITSNEAFHLAELPREIVLVGGGYIGVEFAGIFCGLGVKTTLIERDPLFLPGFDDDLRHGLAEALRHQGIDLRFSTSVTTIERQANGRLRLALTDGDALDCDQVMISAGRRPDTRDLGLEELGVALDRTGAIEVDATYRSSVPSIYAIGDVINRIPLTPVALAEGMVLAGNLFGGQQRVLDYDNIPTAVFSQPCLATVGLTETRAREISQKVLVYRSTFRPLRNTLAQRDEQTMVKLVVDGETDRVLGCHMLGPEAGEIVQGLAVALKCGATKAQFDATIGIHPTSAEEFVTLRQPVE